MPANATRMTKTERREAARQQAERMAAKQAATEKRNRLIIILAAVLVVGLVITAGFLIFRAGQRTLLSDFDGARPADSTDTGGITFGSDLVAGSVNDGAPELHVYLDFMCPACGSFDSVNREDLRAMAADGTATVVLHPLDFLNRFSMGTDYSTRASNAFATVASEAPEYALDFTEIMFDNQPAENTEGLTDDQIAAFAVEVGVPQEIADSFVDGTYSEWVAVAADQASSDGVTGTPTVFIDGSAWDGNWTEPGALRAAVEGS